MQDKPSAFEKRSKRRDILPSFFVVVLIGIAYQEMVSAARDAVRTHGLEFTTIVLPFVFFITTMRFFVGNELHLQSDEMQKIDGKVWFYDLMFIVLETTLLMFLGGLSSLYESRVSPIGFYGLLIAIYAVDVMWVASQLLIPRVLGVKWKREFIPWEWCALNSVLVVLMIATYYVYGGFYSSNALVILTVFNAIGFWVDMILVDKYKML